MILPILYARFERFKNARQEISLDYIGFISQGPLRKTPYIEQVRTSVSLPSSPISFSSMMDSQLYIYTVSDRSRFRWIVSCPTEEHEINTSERAKQKLRMSKL